MARRLPEPIVFGWGYTITRGFEPMLSNVPFNHPSIISNDICFSYACTQYIVLICICVFLKCTVGN